MYYRNAQSALVVYDITKPTSLIKARHWVAELQRQASPGIVIALVGNKVDLTQGEEGAEGSREDDHSTARRAGEDEGASSSNGEGGAGEAVTEGNARKVTTKEARDYAVEEGLLFFETSAKTGLNVQDVFTAIANAIPETQMKGSRGAGGAGGRQSELGSGAERVNLAGPRDAGPKEGCAC